MGALAEATAREADRGSSSARNRMPLMDECELFDEYYEERLLHCTYSDDGDALGSEGAWDFLGSGEGGGGGRGRRALTSWLRWRRMGRRRCGSGTGSSSSSTRSPALAARRYVDISLPVFVSLLLLLFAEQCPIDQHLIILLHLCLI